MDMERITISLSQHLADGFDAWVALNGYSSRSEAVRDLVRGRLGAELLDADQAKWCIATLTYVYDRSEPVVAGRVVQWQHDHHDLVITSQSVPLDHRNCLDTLIARGKTSHLLACGRQLIATRGVRHGNIHLVPLLPSHAHRHDGPGMDQHSHQHLQPHS